MPGTTTKINPEHATASTTWCAITSARSAISGTRWSAIRTSTPPSSWGLEFGEDFGLLKDIGWAKYDGRTEFELKMPPHCLMELLQRLQGEAGMVLGGWAEEEREDVESKERFRRGYDACEKVLGDLDPRAGDRV